MTRWRSASGGAAAQVFLGILTVLSGLATWALASIALARLRSPGGGDWTLLAVVLLPGLITVVFGAATVMAARQRREERAVADRRALNPDQPWLWTDVWRDGRIQAAPGGPIAAALGVFAVMWNAVVAGVAILAYHREDLRGSPTVILFLLLFGLVGLALIGGAVYMLLLARKYAPSVFEMSAVPGVLGGPLGGEIQVPSNVPPGTEARVSLICERLPVGTSRRTTLCLWKDEASLRVSEEGTLRVAFTIPFDLPPSESPESTRTTPSSGIQWRLTATAQVPGVDYSETFDVPVFATEASDRTIVAGQIEPAVSAERPPDAKTSLVESGSDRTVFELAPAKGLGCGLSALLLLPLLTLPIARFSGLQWEATVVAVGVALVVGIGVFALAGAGVLLTATRVEIDREAIRVPHGRWPLCWTRTIPLGDVTEIRYASADTQRVDALTRSGGSYWISGTMSGSEEAKWLAAEVTRAIERLRA